MFFFQEVRALIEEEKSLDYDEWKEDVIVRLVLLFTFTPCSFSEPTLAAFFRLSASAHFLELGATEPCDISSPVSRLRSCISTLASFFPSQGEVTLFPLLDDWLSSPASAPPVALLERWAARLLSPFVSRPRGYAAHDSAAAWARRLGDAAADLARLDDAAPRRRPSIPTIGSIQMPDPPATIPLQNSVEVGIDQILGASAFADAARNDGDRADGGGQHRLREISGQSFGLKEPSPPDGERKREKKKGTRGSPNAESSRSATLYGGAMAAPPHPLLFNSYDANQSKAGMTPRARSETLPRAMPDARVDGAQLLPASGSGSDLGESWSSSSSSPTSSSTSSGIARSPPALPGARGVFCDVLDVPPRAMVLVLHELDVRFMNKIAPMELGMLASVGEFGELSWGLRAAKRRLQLLSSWVVTECIVVSALCAPRVRYFRSLAREALAQGALTLLVALCAALSSPAVALLRVPDADADAERGLREALRVTSPLRNFAALRAEARRLRTGLPLSLLIRDVALLHETEVPLLEEGRRTVNPRVVRPLKNFWQAVAESRAAEFELSPHAPVIKALIATRRVIVDTEIHYHTALRLSQLQQQHPSSSSSSISPPASVAARLRLRVRDSADVTEAGRSASAEHLVDGSPTQLREVRFDRRLRDLALELENYELRIPVLTLGRTILWDDPKAHLCLPREAPQEALRGHRVRLIVLSDGLLLLRFPKKHRNRRKEVGKHEEEEGVAAAGAAADDALLPAAYLPLVGGFERYSVQSDHKLAPEALVGAPAASATPPLLMQGAPPPRAEKGKKEKKEKKELGTLSTTTTTTTHKKKDKKHSWKEDVFVLKIVRKKTEQVVLAVGVPSEAERLAIKKVIVQVLKNNMKKEYI